MTSMTGIAATPSLGSSLFYADTAFKELDSELLPTGCGAIDIALGGGLSYSDVVTVASTSRASRSVLSLHLIASHLVHQTNDVVFMDTSGGLVVETLRDIIADKLEREPLGEPLPHTGYVYQSVQDTPQPASSAKIDKATGMLDRVRIARIFDVTGVVETISEIRDSCDFSNDEAQHTRPKVARPAVGLVVVDDFSSLMTPLIANGHAEAQALLASILRSLKHLANSFHVCAVLLNSVVGSSKPQPNSATVQRRRPEGLSIFESVSGKPALGQAFAGLVDKSILLSRMPKLRKDAEALYGRGSSSQVASAEYVEMLEILKDRSGYAQDHIAAFEILNGRKIVAYAK